MIKEPKFILYSELNGQQITQRISEPNDTTVLTKIKAKSLTKQKKKIVKEKDMKSSQIFSQQLLHLKTAYDQTKRTNDDFYEKHQDNMLFKNNDVMNITSIVSKYEIVARTVCEESQKKQLKKLNNMNYIKSVIVSNFKDKFNSTKPNTIDVSNQVNKKKLESYLNKPPNIKKNDYFNSDSIFNNEDNNSESLMLSVDYLS